MKKACQKVVSLMLALVLIVCMLPPVTVFAAQVQQFTNVSAVPENAIRIRTERELRMMTTGSASANRYYVLENDIHLTQEWIPIGNDSGVFAGTFDGQGHTIHNLFITVRSDHRHQSVHVGLFGTTAGATIKNVTVRIGEQGVNAYGASFQVHAGGLIGNARTTDVINAHVVGHVSANITHLGGWSTGVNPSVGGLIGVFNTESNNRVENSSAIGDVSMFGSGSGVGGLIGALGGSQWHTQRGGIISNSFAAGNVFSVRTSEGRGSAVAGGLIGNIVNRYATITNSYSASNVFVRYPNAGQLSVNVGAGGLIGSGSPSIVSSFRLSTQTVTSDEPIVLVINQIGTPLTPDQMRSQDSFVGWDFDNVWEFRSGENNGFPVLSGQTVSDGSLQPPTPPPSTGFTPTVDTFTLNSISGHIRESTTITGIVTATNTNPILMESRSEWSVYPRGAVTFRDMSVQRLGEGRYALTKTIVPQQTGSFTITARVHDVTATAEIVITEPPMPPFHVKTYIADILADHPMYRGSALGVDNSNMYFGLLNFYRDPSNVSAARILTTQLQSSTGFTNSVTAWEALTFSPSQAMDAAGGWSRRQYYNMILFHLLDAMDFKSRANELYDANAKMLANAMNEQFSMFNDWWGSDVATTLGGFSDAELALFTQEIGNLFDGLGVALDVISIANNAVMTVEQLASNAAAYAAVATVGEDIKAVLREMQQATNDSVLRSAISDMYRAADGALEQVLRNADLTAVTQFAVGESIDVLWGLVFNMSGLSLLLAGQNAGRAISNFVFSTDALIEQYYILQAVVQVEDVMVTTVNRLHTRYVNNRTVANAGAFLAAVDMMVGTYILGATYAYDFARIHDSALVHRFSDAGGPILNLITGNRQSTAQFRASVNSMRSVAEIYRLNNLHLEAYRPYLAIDYPEIYVLLFGIPNSEFASAWAHEGIANAVLNGLVPPQLLCTYTANITRAEFAALAVTLYEVVAGREITGRMQFNDTNDINVQKVGYLQVAFGVDEGVFAPDCTLSREQAAVFLARLAYVIGQPLPPATPTFADNADIFPWALDSVGQVQAAGIMGSVGNNRFAPKDDYTREQSIITMLRLFDFFR